MKSQLPSDIAARKRDEAITAIQRKYADKRDKLMLECFYEIDGVWAEYRREMARNLRQAIAA